MAPGVDRVTPAIHPEGPQFDPVGVNWCRENEGLLAALVIGIQQQLDALLGARSASEAPWPGGLSVSG